MAFKIDPSISWGDIGMGVGLLLTGVIAFTDLTERVSLGETKVEYTARAVNTLAADLSDHKTQEAAARLLLRDDLKGELRDINSKLDKLIERELDGRRQ